MTFIRHQSLLPGLAQAPKLRSRSSHSCFEALRIASKQKWLLRLRNTSESPLPGSAHAPKLRSRSSHSCFEALRMASKQKWLLRLRNPPVNLALLVLLLLYGSCRFGHPEGSERPNISPWSNPAYTVTAQTTYDREFPFLGQRPAGQCQSQCCNVRGRGL